LFAIGHIALAYLLGWSSAKILKVKAILPLIVVLSILPDADLLFGITHRGPTHSVITATVLFIPFLIKYRQKALPYLVALLSHSLIGDFFVGGHLQLLWPISSNMYGFLPLYISITSSINIALENALLIIATLVMFKTQDIKEFFQKRLSNLLLIVPIVTTLLPTFLAYPITVPILLVPGHLFYLVLFSASAAISMPLIFRKIRDRYLTTR
jgi:membrane-bound metal-dependent hydrolase YbcI (DUF457 family)